MTPAEQISRLLDAVDTDQRRAVFDRLRAEFPIHQLETDLAAPAEVILESFSRAGPLTRRMIRGVIAEAAFAIEVVAKLPRWEDVSPPGEHPYDLLLRDGRGPDVRVQVKLQRSEAGAPLITKAGKHMAGGMFVAETDKSRKGKKKGAETRGYRFGSFDILAVSLFPSTRDWSGFRYSLERWLLPRPGEPEWMYKYQPVAREPNEDWTDDLETAVQWLRSDVQKRVAGGTLQDDLL